MKDNLKNSLNGIKNKTLKDIEETKKEFLEKMVTLILGGFGLVAALAWNEAIKSLFETIFPKKSELIGKFTYAIVITIVVVIISLELRKTSEKKK